ncbi:hypothetical protein DRP04_14980 [Archaeoglobales archaeon]|nr:MAG: hypothetical protein DRP04_14980 [Archaeoglobales archaeon]
MRLDRAGVVSEKSPLSIEELKEAIAKSLKKLTESISQKCGLRGTTSQDNQPSNPTTSSLQLCLLRPHIYQMALS